VIASNRKYMRGAGTADHTGDLNRHAAQKFDAQEIMSTCALSKTPFDATTNRNNTIVADPYGTLYYKEAAVQALLTRKQNKDNGASSARTNAIGTHVRRLTDLYEVRFHREDDHEARKPRCPISGKSLTGSIPAILLVPGQDGLSNVVSESALSQLSPEELESEYGQIRRRIRLAPNPMLLEKIKERVQREHDKDDQERRKAKKDKKNKRKRDNADKKKTNIESKNGGNEDERGMKVSRRRSDANTNVSSLSLGKEVQSRVDSAIQQNSVLSSIFTNKSASSKVTEKEKKDNLFAR